MRGVLRPSCVGFQVAGFRLQVAGSRFQVSGGRHDARERSARWAGPRLGDPLVRMQRQRR